MRRPIQIVMALVILVLAGVSIALFQKNTTATRQLADSRAAEDTARTHYAQAFNAIAEIQDSLSSISIRDGNVRLQADGLRSEQGLNAPSRTQALESISQLSASIERTKSRINDLETSLKKSGVKIASLQRVVSGMKKTLVEREEQVAALQGQVSSLQTQVTGLETTVQEDQATIEAKRKELATVFVAIGTKKELKDKGVIIQKGGALGLGKTVVPTGNPDVAAYTAIDTDHETVVSVPSEKAKVVSAQPPSSYQLTTLEGRTELRILDPVEFRKVRHLVIVTA
ncbi:MAG TPA: hypothetical protein VJY35_05700 [Candidatus Eisenbacteria bacterium]|nr:hypothetical protein [Candidatus Eisenbacteria bacterium]